MALRATKERGLRVVLVLALALLLAATGESTRGVRPLDQASFVGGVAARVISCDTGRRAVTMSRKRSIVAVFVLLVFVAAVARFGFGYPGDLPCQWHEGREGSRYVNRPTRLEDVRAWAAEEGLTLAVVGTETIHRPGAVVELPAGDAFVQTRNPEVGDVTSASACRPAGVREQAEVYVRVAVRA